MLKSSVNLAKITLKVFLFVFCILFALTAYSFAGGSTDYDDLLSKFPDDVLTFKALEQILEFDKDDVWAETHIGSNVSMKFAGMRLGPYYVCAKQKYGQNLLVLVIFTTENMFIDKKERLTEYPDNRTVFIKEKLIGVRIEAASATNPFHRCYER